MFSEDELLPLSGLQHMVFCERQAALIHLEQVWTDNVLTVEGTHLHDTVDAATRESRGSVRIARGLRLRSLRLGLAGKADVVEFHRVDADAAASPRGITLSAAQGRWRPFPVEYKRGRPKPYQADEVQLCAQALCLEEMLNAEVVEGALFYGQIRRRLVVDFDASLRVLTESTAAEFHALMSHGVTPAARYEPKCDRCSLMELCRPKINGAASTRYVRDLFNPK